MAIWKTTPWKQIIVGGSMGAATPAPSPAPAPDPDYGSNLVSSDSLDGWELLGSAIGNTAMSSGRIRITNTAGTWGVARHAVAATAGREYNITGTIKAGSGNTTLKSARIQFTVHVNGVITILAQEEVTVNGSDYSFDIDVIPTFGSTFYISLDAANLDEWSSANDTSELGDLSIREHLVAAPAPAPAPAPSGSVVTTLWPPSIGVADLVSQAVETMSQPGYLVYSNHPYYPGAGAAYTKTQRITRSTEETGQPAGQGYNLEYFSKDGTYLILYNDYNNMAIKNGDTGAHITKWQPPGADFTFSVENDNYGYTVTNDSTPTLYRSGHDYTSASLLSFVGTGARIGVGEGRIRSDRDWLAVFVQENSNTITVYIVDCGNTATSREARVICSRKFTGQYSGSIDNGSISKLGNYLSLAVNAGTTDVQTGQVYARGTHIFQINDGAGTLTPMNYSVPNGHEGGGTGSLLTGSISHSSHVLAQDSTERFAVHGASTWGYVTFDLSDASYRVEIPPAKAANQGHVSGVINGWLICSHHDNATDYANQGPSSHKGYAVKIAGRGAATSNDIRFIGQLHHPNVGTSVYDNDCFLTANRQGTRFIWRTKWDGAARVECFMAKSV